MDRKGEKEGWREGKRGKRKRKKRKRKEKDLRVHWYHIPQTWARGVISSWVDNNFPID